MGWNAEMVFKRRDKPPFWDRAREMFAPRKGWRRGYLYLGKRMQRLPDTPHRIALGFACGMQASFTPFFGFHFVVAGALAWITRANILSSAVGTFMGNPLTFPFIAAASFYMGRVITGIHFDEPVDGYSFGWLWDNLDAIFLPYLVGGLLPGLACSVACYLVVRPMVAAFQARRRLMLMERAKARMKEHAARAAASRQRRAEARAETKAAKDRGGAGAAPS